MACLALTGTASAADVRNVLPPGANGLSNLAELGAFLTTGARPAHNDDQLALYAGLLRAPRPFTEGTLDALFKSADFGVPPGGAASTEHPRPDVTIVRDSAYGVPHVTGATREAAMFGVGYATAHDRLFFMDIFRHLGRAELASFAGGDPANRAFDALMWSVAPYTEADLQRQVDSRPRGFEQQADQLRSLLNSYVAGVNEYIAEARLDPTKMPGEYAAIGRPQGPDDWKPTDVIATAAVVGAIFGVGGGEEVRSALALQAARTRFGRRGGDRAWADFREADDPDSPTIVHRGRFPYGLPPRRARGVALPDPGSIKIPPTVAEAGAPGDTTRAARLVAFPRAESNALLVSARESASGHPLAVFGPQTGYFSPQALLEQDVHAPGLDARGVAFPGINLFVQIGRGRDYAWSATTSAQDIVDTFAVDLCDPGGGPARIDSTGYRWHGACLPFEVLERQSSWQPNAADSTPAGSETLRTERSNYGLVVARGTVRGRPMAFTSLRATYRHEADSGLAFLELNDPGFVHGPADFQRAAAQVPFTFNWFYVDSSHIAYQNAGANPLHAPGTDPNLPILARRANEWRNWTPGFSDRALTESSTPAAAHPHAVDQAYFADWNGKQGHGYAAADGNWGYGPVYRSGLLDERVRALIAGPRKATLPALAQAMADAATVDLRGEQVLPWALKVLRGERDPTVRGALDTLAAWARDGAHRIDADGDGRYEHADAIRIMDAWWPRWLHAEFQPTLGKPLFEAIAAVHPLDNPPNNEGDHVGSAWQDGWYSFAAKDLRKLLHPHTRAQWSRAYCGGGRLARCRAALAASLADAVKADPATLYKDKVCAQAGRDGDQSCFDAIWHRPLGGITQPLIPWQNRPTFQQVVEFAGAGR
jgi:acyl-homoserine lactone acylase PvdQ